MVKEDTKMKNRTNIRGGVLQTGNIFSFNKGGECLLSRCSSVMSI